MIISCTKKLQDELGIKPSLLVTENPIYSWHANVIMVNRRKTVVLVNDASRYNIILYGLKAKDFRNIESTILLGIHETFLSDGVNDEVIDKYMEEAGQIVFSKTQNRTLVARLNKGCEAAGIFYDCYSEDGIAQPLVSQNANKFIFIDYSDSYMHPDEMFYKQLHETFKLPIIKCKALKLSVKMKLEKFDIWRNVIVPLKFTFEELHKVMQKLFGWKDYHLHDFMIFHETKPIINIVGSEKNFEYQTDIPMVLENGVKISEYLPKYKRINYRYDYGDNWEHIIQIEDMIFDYDKNYAYCIDGHGDAPPEDVGGEGGFQEFIKIISNPENKEYQHMKQWADSQWYKGFDIEMVNVELQNI
ncbi:Plasmid pRiA4b ORF-3-like protein [Clostridium liquoris]|uniref:Plasmid pRiA4b ORF-3-like protein n=1 Tax=Clostridium liquoris TaxID=1289519 RepID=A0A2T0B2B2_9CLOT|nr:plasmid pRiA4b ORF-3 family protein [Clostridium liquoris]PRR78028.1 Plasmid pRiA4b ORF-3-like protein [Clostridium liquoris]